MAQLQRGADTYGHDRDYAFSYRNPVFLNQTMVEFLAKLAEKATDLRFTSKRRFRE
ncbi:hypothetical protein KUV24_23880 [Nitratireductor sp. DP7N14-4]|nr:hypothetical protein [Nitratireductor sp. DP7N14-4]